MNYDMALKFATEKHSGQYRKHGPEYINHPIAVVEILKAKGIIDESFLILALFHDLLEDTDANRQDILYFGSSEILESVEILTKEDGYDMDEYMKKVGSNPKAKIVKIADRISNLDDIVFLDDIDFITNYLEETERYFLELAKNTILKDELLNRISKVKEKLR